MIEIPDGQMTYYVDPPPTQSNLPGDSYPKRSDVDQLERRGYWWCVKLICRTCGHGTCLGHVDNGTGSNHGQVCFLCGERVMVDPRGPHVHVRGRRPH